METQTGRPAGLRHHVAARPAVEVVVARRAVEDVVSLMVVRLVARELVRPSRPISSSCPATPASSSFKALHNNRGDSAYEAAQRTGIDAGVPPPNASDDVMPAPPARSPRPRNAASAPLGVFLFEWIPSIYADGPHGAVHPKAAHPPPTPAVRTI